MGFCGFGLVLGTSMLPLEQPGGLYQGAVETRETDELRDLERDLLVSCELGFRSTESSAHTDSSRADVDFSFT